ncbi:neurogenic locus notch homolog protein 4-like, partial [Pollicipes pollicipes]|uniref:neurogenic locus notch homolog protein 4-like n=1 Tax=Pollicipes pollicipes TaxID=41117 RepID=UPI001884D65C
MFDTDPACVVADACAAHRPCRNGATCRRGPARFSCLCEPRDPCPLQRDVCGVGFNCTRSEPTITPRCHIDNICLASDPCRNGGTCVSRGGTTFECACAPAWQGAVCADERDPCSAGTTLCQRGFPCARAPLKTLGYACDCSRPGWRPLSDSNPRCVVSDVCLARRPCLNGEDEPGCVIADHCMASTPCRNGGTCLPEPGGFNCSCAPAWSGADCAAVADPYAEPRCHVVDPCVARRPCKNNEEKPACVITDGEKCREPRDPCLQKPSPCGDARWGCKRDADSGAGYSCDCNLKGWGSKGVSQPRCVVVDECLARNPCRNGGTCTGGAGGLPARCQCTLAWTGSTCRRPRDPCRQSFCGQPWQCARDPLSPAGYSCGCDSRPGYKVVSGQAPRDPCQGAQPCGPGWPCSRDPTTRAGYSCGCEARPGYHPTSEENPSCRISDVCLAKKPCQNGATCQPGEGAQFTCACRPAWSGTLCATERDPCAQGSPCGRFSCQRDANSTGPGYRCSCEERPGYRPASPTNRTCVLWNVCAIRNHCHNGGVCSPAAADMPKCAVSNICLAARDVCHHGGTCSSLGGRHYRCDCAPAWRGRRCSSPTDPCAEDGMARPCGPGWRCQRAPHRQLGYNCSCDTKPGWRAKSKSDPRCVVYDRCLADRPCLNGGSCSPRRSGFACACRPAWS